ncbi:amino acid permease [Allokutzneria albata]|uniref:L-asparagine transporter n=1 Tax=Allokutzneria albata TaxID=211114 RepID=A0A1H0DMU1_ALLAB|nr:amino acid permease [Allokutzneria albata]SDN71557.1 L-asparagine transporter [Allokutzneria albata]
MNEGTGLRRELSGRQVGMIALGGAIGTGLFLGSGLAISLAGPAVVVVYAVAAVVALALAYALAEMTAVHPEAGGFGAISHRYLGPLAGFVQRWLYIVAQVVNIGSEVVAAGLYVQFWWPDVPLWAPVVGFSVLILTVNTLSVRFFGEFEYWFAMIKVATIVVFIGIGVYFLLFGFAGHPSPGLSAVTGHGGFLPNGLGAAWLALSVVTFSYMGTEAVTLTAAESRDPERDVPRAARSMVLRLGLFYVLGTAVLVLVVPWTEAAGTEGITQSPFVRLFEYAGIPAAAGVMNFVVLTAALSAMNTNLYLSSRMAHSLAIVGHAPRSLLKISSRGVPTRSLAVCALGLVLAVLASVFSPQQAFPLLIGAALFSGLMAWIIIFATHVAFRRARDREGAPPSPIRLPGAPATSVLAAVMLVAVLVTTGFTDQFFVAWLAGPPFLVLLVLAYLPVRRRAAARAAEPAT